MMNGHETLFAQLSTLSASVALLLGIALLWRRSLGAYIKAFRWQSLTLSVAFALIGYFGHDSELYVVAAVLLALKAIIIPWYLNRLQARVGAEREAQPYVNIATSLIVAGLLVMLAYAITRPLVMVSKLPTRGAIPLAVGLIFVGLFVIVSRRKALTQIVGFLVLENGISLLAALCTYGIPLIVELGVFLDVLMGYLVMQIIVYQIRDTFESIDVEQLNQLKH
jgi:hydrogenase-4 component E